MMNQNLRYQRQIQLARVGQLGQIRLQQARVLVVGAGGLSASLLPLLAASGLGKIRLYDADRVELHNLHRQILFRMADLGTFKVNAAKQHLLELNPECDVEVYAETLNNRNIEYACQDVDVVVDAADRFSLTYLLSDYCYEHNLAFISASVLAEQGYVAGFCGGRAPSYRAVFPHPPTHAHSCQSSGVMPSTVATIASLQAHMVTNVILQQQPSALGQMLSIDLAQWHTQQFRFDDAREPSDPLLWLAPNQLLNDDILIELRSADECPTSIHPHIQRMSIADLQAASFHPNWPTTRRIVCICQTGIRAYQAVQILKSHGYASFAICAAHT